MAEIPHVEKPVCEYAKKLGFHVRKVAWTGRRGAPDRLFFGHGIFFFVEFKDRKKPPEQHQIREHKRMRDNGMLVFVVDTEAKGRDLIDRIISDRQAVRELGDRLNDDLADEFF